MGLSESKSPFQADGGPSKPEIDGEMGISQMLDPRSPSNNFERTPVHYRSEKSRADGDDMGMVVGDPRSPSNEIKRTPITAHHLQETKTDEDTGNELWAKIQQLELFGTPILHLTNSSDSLSSDKEIIHSAKTILKLQEEQSSQLEHFDSICLSSTPSRPRSTTTSKEKERKPSKVRRKTKTSQHSKKSLKKAFVEKSPRSPLAERNGDVNHERKPNNDKNSKTTALIRYKKYNNLEESLVEELFPGKENTEIV